MSRLKEAYNHPEVRKYFEDNRAKKKIETSNVGKIFRRFAKGIKPLGFERVRSTFFVREREYVYEFIHIHKYSFAPDFRIHICLRVINDSFDPVALTGMETFPVENEYDFSFENTEESIERSSSDLVSFVEEVAEPWYKEWRDLESLANSDESPLRDEEKLALKEALSDNSNEENVLRTKEFFKKA